jgi:hypothetical protein
MNHAGHHAMQHHHHEHHAAHAGAGAAAGPGLNRTALLATLHCLSGCAVGEVLGMVIGTAMGLSNGATICLAVVLAFVFGYAFTIVPLLRAGMRLPQAGRLAFLADTASIAVMEAVDNLVMLVVPGANGGASFIGALLVRTGLRARGRGVCGVPIEPVAHFAR